MYKPIITSEGKMLSIDKLTNSILTQTITSSEAANNEPANKCFTSPTEVQVR